MSCFPCFGRRNSSKDNDDEDRQIPVTKPVNKEVVTPKDATPKKPGHAHKASIDGDIATTVGNIQAKAFTFRELAAATKNFRPDFLVGEGGFGRVYKGCLESNKQVVAIKQLDKNSFPSSKEFLAEVLNLSRLNHPNLVNLIGYCADGEQKLLVYEYLPLGSLENHILDLQPNKKPLSWEIRMNIAYGLAQGLEYLHDKANPQVIYRDLKSGNVLLDEHNNARLSDIGLAKLGPASENMHLSLGMIDGTYGYSAPEFERNGQVSVKADVYSFGVILLELITGRRAIDSNKEMDEQNLVAWAMPIVKDQKRLPEIVDPLLNGNYPVKALNQAVAMATMCVQEEASVRPMMADVVMALSFLSMEQNSQPGCSSSPNGASLDDSTQIEWYKPEDPTAALGVITMDSSTSRQQLEP